MPVLNAVEPKAPAEIKYYTMDWTGGLNSGATVSGSVWALSSSELTNVTDGIVSGSLKTTIKLSGGIEGQTYLCTNTITTSDGETRSRVGVLKVMTEGVDA